MNIISVTRIGNRIINDLDDITDAEWKQIEAYQNGTGPRPEWLRVIDADRLIEAPSTTTAQ